MSVPVLSRLTVCSLIRLSFSLSLVPTLNSVQFMTAPPPAGFKSSFKWTEGFEGKWRVYFLASPDLS